jgi:FAD dependent oxidoreductase TIGR03364
MKHSDIIIIGGGILGLSHAYHSLTRGLTVTLFEKDAKAVGSSIQNFGQIVPSGFGAKWQKYGRKSLSIYEHIQNEYDIHIRKEGSIYVASDNEELSLIEELHQINKTNDYSSTLLSSNDCINLYPQLKKDYCKGGLLFAQEYNADSRWTIPSITHYLIAKFQLNVQFSTQITSLDIENNKVIVADYKGDKWSTDKVIICNGSDFKSLLPNLYADSDIELVKLQMLETIPQLKNEVKGSILTGWTIRRYESFKECPSFDIIKSKEDKNSFHNKFGIHILFKQLATGGIIIGDSHEYSSIENESDLKLNEIDYGINDFMVNAANEIMDLDYKISKSWVGLYSQSKTEELFTKNIENKIYIATAIGGKGMTGSLGWAEEHITHIFE